MKVCPLTKRDFSLPFGDLTLTWNCSSYERSKHRGRRLEPSKAEVGWLLGTPMAMPGHFLLCVMELPMIQLLSHDFFWDLQLRKVIT